MTAFLQVAELAETPLQGRCQEFESPRLHSRSQAVFGSLRGEGPGVAVRIQYTCLVIFLPCEVGPQSGSDLSEDCAPAPFAVEPIGHLVQAVREQMPVGVQRHRC